MGELHNEGCAYDKDLGIAIHNKVFHETVVTCHYGITTLLLHVALLVTRAQGNIREGQTE